MKQIGIAALLVITPLMGSIFASDAPKNCKQDLIYLTDHPEDLRETLENREKLYTPSLREDWADARAKFVTNQDGEEILLIKGFEVMRGFEKPYMASIAKAAVAKGGRVLNVGYGIGYIDDQIEKQGGLSEMTEHHIVELNRDVLERAKEWRESQSKKDQIFLHPGDWREMLLEFKRQRIQFDGIAYDAFPLEVRDLHRDFIPFLERVIELRLLKENTGVITFYMDSADGFGKTFRSYAERLGVSSFDLERIHVELPQNQYWRRPYFLTPTLSGVKYSD